MSLRRRVSRALRGRELTWRYLFNRRPTLAYRFDGHRLGAEERRVAADLERNGLAISTVSALLGSTALTALFDELVAEVRSAEDLRRDEILRAREAAKSDVAQTTGEKKFLLELLGLHPVLDPDSVFARFALARPFLDVANAYFGMYTQLRHYNVWRNFPSSGGARTSQLWHRDREDRQILKCFVYLSDVEADSGPLTYVPGSHAAGPRRAEPESFLEAGVRRTNDEQMAKVYPPDTWIRALGKAGTVVFADTRGFHKGGLVEGRDRVMFLSMFTSGASQSDELFQRPRDLRVPADPAVAFALGRPGSAGTASS